MKSLMKWLANQMIGKAPEPNEYYLNSVDNSKVKELDPEIARVFPNLSNENLLHIFSAVPNYKVEAEIIEDNSLPPLTEETRSEYAKVGVTLNEKYYTSDVEIDDSEFSSHAQDFINNSSCSTEAGMQYVIDEAMKSHQKVGTWVKILRALNIKAAHPNDGWVDRNQNKFSLCYPFFDDGIKVGDKVMLGSNSDNDRNMIVEVTHVNANHGCVRYNYKKI